MPTLLSDVRCWVNSGKHLLAASISPFDPGCVKTRNSSRLSRTYPFLLVRRPAAIHWQTPPVIEAAALAGQKEVQRAELLDRSEALVRLLSQQHVTYDLLTRNAMRLGLTVDLRLDQRRINVTRADRIAGDALCSSAVTLVRPRHRRP